MNKWVPGLLLFGGLLMMVSLPFAVVIAATSAITTMDTCTLVAMIFCMTGFVLGASMVARGAVLAARRPEEETDD